MFSTSAFMSVDVLFTGQDSFSLFKRESSIPCSESGAVL